MCIRDRKVVSGRDEEFRTGSFAFRQMSETRDCQARSDYTLRQRTHKRGARPHISDLDVLNARTLVSAFY